MKYKFLLFYACVCFFISCNSKNEENIENYIVQCLDGNYTGLKFYSQNNQNEVGLGFGISDFNQDKLQDIFMHIGDSAFIFLNNGDFKFTKFYLDEIDKFYLTSLVIVDFNNDSLDDVVFTFLDNDSLGLILYQNLGILKFNKVTSIKFLNKPRSIPFKATLIDYNNDGFIDFHLTSWKFEESAFRTSFMRSKFSSDTLFQSDYWIKNINGIKFIKETHFRNKSYPVKHLNSFGSHFTDINNDENLELYVPNDFNIPDFLFKINSDKYNDISHYISTTSYFSMGSTIADLNNDGFEDIVTADMRRSDNYKQKSTIYEVPYEWSLLNKNFSYDLTKQQVKNTFQLNINGLGFSEVSEQFNIDKSDWSWGILALDFNNDGYKDLFFTNGAKFDYKFSHDYPLIVDSLKYVGFVDSLLFINSLINRLKTNNKLYLNNYPKPFIDFDISKCGCIPSFSSGVAYADLNNDGSLEIIIFNNNDFPTILKNNSNRNFLRINLLNESNRSVIYSKANIFYEGKMQKAILNPQNGFLSSSEHIIHFGLGKQTKADSLIITWPNGRQTLLKNIAANQIITIEYIEKETRDKPQIKKSKPFLKNENFSGLKFLHKENDYNDFQQNMLLPQMYSKFGPYIATGDLTGNGLNDIIIGGSKGYPTSIFYQLSTGNFKKDTTSLALHSFHEDAGLTIFDINQDGLNDIIIVSGGNELPNGNNFYKHRYYINKGKGVFEPHYIQGVKSSASVVKPFFINNKTYLFIGGRIKAQQYPLTPYSYLLEYSEYGFKNVSKSWLPNNGKLGMVTDAIWSDFNKDGSIDLIVVGEYLSPLFLKNIGNQFFDITKQLIGDSLFGFWNCIVSDDFNNDGYPDYVIGNLGLNTRYKASRKYPLEIYANDFDDNESLDVITCFYEKNKLYPIKNLKTFKQRINGFSKKYYRHSLFATHTLFDMFDNKLLQNGFHAVAHTTASIVLLSDGIGGYIVKNLPFWAQVSPIMAMLVDDVDNDGFEDILIGGNFYPLEVERGRYTAQKGLLLKGDSKGNFKEILPNESGFWVDGECRSIAPLKTKKGRAYLVAFNSEKLKVFIKY